MEREMELAEYIKALSPDRIRKIIEQNAQLLHEREALRTVNAGYARDNRQLTKRLDEMQAKLSGGSH